MAGKMEQAIRIFYKNDPELLDLAAVIAARLAAVWNNAQGKSIAARFTELLAAADREIEKQKESSRLPIPCKAGCNHCCSFPEITVSATEAVLIVKHIEQRMTVEQRAAAVASIRASGTTGENKNSPCALLKPEGCSVYESRPVPCRSYYSTSEPACRACKSTGAEYPYNLPRTRVVEAAVFEVSRVYARSRRYELNALLRRIYSDPAKVREWAAERPTDEPSIAKPTRTGRHRLDQLA